MKRPHDGAVPGIGADIGHLPDNILFGYICTRFFSKVGRHFSHLQRNGGVIRAQIRMPLACIDNNQAVILCPEVKVYLLYNRFFRILKIDGNKASDCAGHLIQQPGCFIPEMILRIFSNMGVSHHIHLTAVKKCIQHGADQHLIGRRGAYSGRADDIACDIGVKTADLVAFFFKALKNSLGQIDGSRHFRTGF